MSRISLVSLGRASRLLAFPQRRLLARNLSILVAGDFLGRLLMMAAFAHLARTLQPALFGAMEFALAVVMILTLVVDLGLKTLGARNVARLPQQTDRLAGSIVSVQVLIAVAVYCFLLLALWLLPLGGAMKWLLAGYGLILFAHPFILNWVFQGRKEMGWVALPQFLRQATFAVLAILFVRAPAQVLRLPLLELVGVALAVAVNLVAFRRIGARLTLGTARSGVKELAGRGVAYRCVKPDLVPAHVPAAHPSGRTGRQCSDRTLCCAPSDHDGVIRSAPPLLDQLVSYVKPGGTGNFL